jgi:sugar/nucleoside kinase (ribokinase family)
MDHYPVENQKMRLSMKKVECGGGSASNCAYLLAKWGVNTSFSGIIGNDYYGKSIIDDYVNIGVDVKYLEVTDKFNTTSSYIIANTSNGSRTIITSRDPDIVMEPKDYDKDEFDYILLDGYEKDNALKALENNPRAISVLDAGSKKEATVELAHKVTYLVCSHDFANQVSGTTIDYDNIETIINAYNILKQEFKNNVIITLESYGSFTEINGEYKLITSTPVKALDSTGAGDIFHGAFLYSLTQGFDLEKALKFANITGALSCLRIGGRFSIPELKEVEDKYNDIV